MNFFIWRNNNVSFLRYLDFCVFVKSTDFKIRGIIISIATKWKLHLCLFLLNPKSYKNETWSNTSVLLRNISKIFLPQCWRLETSSRPFYYIIKTAVGQDLTIFNSGHLPFFIVPYSLFQKNETLESWHN